MEQVEEVHRPLPDSSGEEPLYPGQRLSSTDRSNGEREGVKTRIELIAGICMETEEGMATGFMDRRGAMGGVADCRYFIISAWRR